VLDATLFDAALCANVGVAVAKPIEATTATTVAPNPTFNHLFVCMFCFSLLFAVFRSLDKS
jgi:hypothetical protein